MKDFFISYTQVDVASATWVAELLEKNDYTVIIQEWDFRPGDNFVSKINEGLKICKKMIIILSEAYLKSKWCEAEWTAKLAEQIQLNESKIIPIKIASVNLRGLLSSISYIDIVDMDEENAQVEILNKIKEHTLRKSISGYRAYYNVEYLQIDNDYYVTDTKIYFQKTCVVKILTDGLNSLHNRISWFADESIKLDPLTKDIKIEILDIKDTNLNYNVIFNHKFCKNEIIEYSVKAVLTNNNKHFKNFLSTEVITPVKKLNIHLRIEDESISKYFTQKISSSLLNERTEAPVEHDLYEQAHWYIDNPEIHFEYKIYW